MHTTTSLSLYRDSYIKLFDTAGQNVSKIYRTLPHLLLLCSLVAHYITYSASDIYTDLVYYYIRVSLSSIATIQLYYLLLRAFQFRRFKWQVDLFPRKILYCSESQTLRYWQSIWRFKYMYSWWSLHGRVWDVEMSYMKLYGYIARVTPTSHTQSRLRLHVPSGAPDAAYSHPYKLNWAFLNILTYTNFIIIMTLFLN